MTGKTNERKLEVAVLLKIEDEAAKGRNNKDEEGRVGRKGENLESEDEAEYKVAEEAAVETITTTGAPLLAEEDTPKHVYKKTVFWCQPFADFLSHGGAHSKTKRTPVAISRFEPLNFLYVCFLYM